MVEGRKGWARRGDVAAGRGRVCGLCFLLFVSTCFYRSVSGRKGRELVPCITRSSGRLSRTRLRVRFPQSLDFTRCARAKSQPLLRGKDSVSISMSIVPSMPCGHRVGDSASGVETAPKLKIETGDSSSMCLRFISIIAILSVSVLSEKLCDGVCRVVGEFEERRLWCGKLRWMTIMLI